MKVCFWSYARGKAGVTTNLACIAAMIALEQKTRAIMLENHYSANSLGDVFFFPEQLKLFRESGEYYSRYGIEYILKRMYSGEEWETLLRRAAFFLLSPTFAYLPQGRIVNKEVFNYEFHLVYKDLFRVLEQITDYVFIDTETSQNLSSNLILSESDLIVVNLPQNPEQIREYFTNYARAEEKSVYLIGSYQPTSEWNIARLCQEFSIPKSRIGVIPYNLDLKDALDRGRLLQFLSRNYYQPSDEENEQLMHYVKKACRMVKKNAAIVRRSNGLSYRN